jgi:hypothetical protein
VAIDSAALTMTTRNFAVFIIRAFVATQVADSNSIRQHADLSQTHCNL